MKKSIFYWSPYLGRVATIRSVLNSMIGLSNLKKKKFKISIINCFGEWNQNIASLKKNNIETINLQKKIMFNIDIYGLVLSRFVYFSTFFLTYRKLKNLLIEKKPDYLIVHLLTFIPFILFYNNKFKTKLILRISGKPILSFYRFFLWKLMNRKIHLIFCPTLETKKYLLEKKIFDKKKIQYLPDPILYDNDIRRRSTKKVKYKFKKNSYFLSVGRLTKQKNHELLLKALYIYDIQEKLLIIGDGELLSYLKKLIRNFSLEKKVKIINYQKNIFDYIKRSKAVIIPSLWEDPGFVMVEAAYLKKTIICSDCPSGPKEFIKNGKGGFLFKSNSMKSLKKAIDRFNKTNKKEIFQKIKYAKDKCKIYTINNHSKIINNFLFR